MRLCRGAMVNRRGSQPPLGKNAVGGLCRFCRDVSHDCWVQLRPCETPAIETCDDRRDAKIANEGLHTTGRPPAGYRKDNPGFGQAPGGTLSLRRKNLFFRHESSILVSKQ